MGWAGIVLAHLIILDDKILLFLQPDTGAVLFGQYFL